MSFYIAALHVWLLHFFLPVYKHAYAFQYLPTYTRPNVSLYCHRVCGVYDGTMALPHRHAGWIESNRKEGIEHWLSRYFISSRENKWVTSRKTPLNRRTLPCDTDVIPLSCLYPPKQPSIRSLSFISTQLYPALSLLPRSSGFPEGTSLSAKSSTQR